MKRSTPPTPQTQTRENRPYKKFRHLVADPDTPSKVNPSNDDKLLVQVFAALEALVTFYKGRMQENELLWHQLQQSLTNTTGRNISVKHLRDIVAIYPGCYTIELAKWQGAQTYRINWPNSDEGRSQQASQLNDRKKVFQDKLMSFRLKHGQDAPYPLSNLPSLVVPVKSGRIMPALFKSIEPTVKKQDDLMIVHSSIKLDGMSVLEKIKLKQQQKLQTPEVVVDKAKLNENATMSQLPMFVDLLLSMFKSKKSAYLKDVTSRAIETSKVPLSSYEIGKMIDALAETVPEWLSKNKSEFGVLIKVHHSIQRSQILAQLSQ